MDKISRERRSYVMSRIRSVSSIEVLPREYEGLYLRRHPKGVFGRPDFGNKFRRIALFIDGCYWHHCPQHGTVPKTNASFWREKFRKNARRDRLVTAYLKKRGFRVIRIWEHEL